MSCVSPEINFVGQTFLDATIIIKTVAGSHLSSQIVRPDGPSGSITLLPTFVQGTPIYVIPPLPCLAFQYSKITYQLTLRLNDFGNNLPAVDSSVKSYKLATQKTSSGFTSPFLVDINTNSSNLYDAWAIITVTSSTFYLQPGRKIGETISGTSVFCMDPTVSLQLLDTNSPGPIAIKSPPVALNISTTTDSETIQQNRRTWNVLTLLQAIQTQST